jgi:two-component system, OmpR family, phosphate regulon sensor histidine kinase PhoR
MSLQANILVVDDERGIREGCRRILTSNGHNVDVAENGQQGFDLIQKSDFDLVLVDLMMPVMGGIEMMEKALQNNPELIMIVITGFATVETAVDAMKHGAYDYIPKPFAPDQLLTVVNRGLEKHRLRQQTKQLMEERDRRLLEVTNEKSKIHTIVNSMVDGVLVINRDQQLVLWNPAAMKMLNITKKFESGQELAKCISHTELIRTIDKAIDPKSAHYTSLSEEIELNDPEPQTLMANVSVVRDENNEMLGVVCIIRDITQLKEIDRVKSQFVSMVAHELRAPLSAIENYITTYLTGAAGENPEFNRNMLERSKLRAHSLLNLVEDLLQISRIESQTISRKKELLDITEIINNTIELLKPQGKEKNIKFEILIPKPCPTIEADRGEMEQLFTNFISNAIKYNVENGSVSVALKCTDNFLEIRIIDTGIGLAKNDLTQIFDEFYRVSREETRYITGTGLGLAIVKKIVENHLGRISVESELNKGSTFIISFPIKKKL